MDKSNFTERILSLTLEVIHLLTGEEYIVVRKSSVPPRWSTTQATIEDPPLPFRTPETKNMKKILHVTNNIIHLLTGEVLGCFENQADVCEDVMIYEQPSASQEIPRSRNKLEGWQIQATQEGRAPINRAYRGSSPKPSDGSKLSQPTRQQKGFFPDLDMSKRQSRQPSPCSPPLQEIEMGSSADDHDDLEYTMVQIKEELGLWEDGEALQDHCASAENSVPKNITQCRSSKNGPSGPDCINTNSQPHSSSNEGSTSPRDPTSSPTRAIGNTYKCPECPESFSCHSDLLKHQSHHRGSPLFSCLLCGKNFTSKSNLAKHQKIHTGEKPYSCTECGKRFREKHYLASHQAVHRGAQLIVCPQCGKGYTSKSNLAKHQRIHTGQKPFSCSTCSKSFNQRSVLLAHQRTHTGEKPFSCDLCARRFTDKLQLTRHQATHSEEKLFCCNECGKSFNRRDSLLKHLASHSVDGFLG